jgi:hypothetical protein
MKRAINIAAYLFLLAGGSFIAWSAYSILTVTHVALWASGPFGFASVPRMIITSPGTAVVSQPSIQVAGCFPVEIKSVTCDISNSVGTNVNQAEGQIKGMVTTRFFDPAKAAYTTNCFQLNDINLAQGKNRINIHVRDAHGKQYSMRQSFTLVSPADLSHAGDADLAR